VAQRDRVEGFFLRGPRRGDPCQRRRSHRDPCQLFKRTVLRGFTYEDLATGTLVQGIIVRGPLSKDTFAKGSSSKGTLSQEPYQRQLVAGIFATIGFLPSGSCHRDLTTGFLSYGPCQGDLVSKTLSQGPCYKDLFALTSPREPFHGVVGIETLSRGPLSQESWLRDFVAGTLLGRKKAFRDVDRGHSDLDVVKGTSSRGPCHRDLGTGTVTRTLSEGPRQRDLATGIRTVPSRHGKACRVVTGSTTLTLPR